MSIISIISSLTLFLNVLITPVNTNYYLDAQKSDTQIFFSISSQPNKNIYPLKKNNDSLGVQISAQSALVKDLNSQKILWSKNKDEIRSIASITKLMTALVILELPDINWDQEIAITEEDTLGDLNKLKMYNWEKIKFSDLFIASLITSSNSGIELLVKNTGLTKEEFVNKMNLKAQELKLSQTKFVEPTGLEPNNVSTAHELLILIEQAFQKNKIKQATSQKKYTFLTDQNRSVTIQNTNDLIGGYLNIDAGKTGYIEEAGYCLASEVSYQEKGPLLVVVLGSASHYERFSDLKAISGWIFENYNWPQKK